MGGACTRPATEKSARRRNKEIELALTADRNILRREIKMLMLGAGDSGKSTIVKQSRIIHGGGYSESARMEFAPVIYFNILRSMQTMVKAAASMGIELGEEGETQAAFLLGLDKCELVVMPPESVVAIEYLWSLPQIQEVYKRRREFQLNDSVKYFMNSMDRVAMPNYVPSEQDILHSREPTTAVMEFVFQYGNVIFRMVDVGGQRSQRRKWIQCFADITAIIFMVALSEYDQVLVEDEMQCRMYESLALFDNIVNYEWFVNTSIILFLNKTDILDEKLAYSDFSAYFPEFKGDAKDPGQVKVFVINKFFQLNRQPQKTIYSHFTCATNTDNIKYVFAAVRDTILQTNLRNVSLI